MLISPRLSGLYLLFSSETLEFFLMFSLNSVNSVTKIKRAQTCHLLCKRLVCYHSASKTHLNWVQFMLQLFIRFPEFAEFTEFNESSAPFRKNSILNGTSLLSMTYNFRRYFAIELWTACNVTLDCSEFLVWFKMGIKGSMMFRLMSRSYTHDNHCSEILVRHKSQLLLILTRIFCPSFRSVYKTVYRTYYRTSHKCKPVEWQQILVCLF